MDDAAYWKRRAEEAEAKLEKEREAKIRNEVEERLLPRCKNCKGPRGVYNGWCAECMTDHDL